MREAAVTDAVLLSLSLAGGVLDVTSYIAFGKIFTANMTGNTVLLGVALADGLNTHAVRAITALGGYCLGAFVGSRLITRGNHRWPGKARRTLGLQLLGLVALLVVWTICGVPAVRYELILIGSAAMGLQSITGLASGAGGVNTTYMTGTLTRALARLASGLHRGPDPEQSPALGWMAWITYGAGALLGALAVGSWRSAVLALPITIVAAVWLCAQSQFGCRLSTDKPIAHGRG